MNSIDATLEKMAQLLRTGNAEQVQPLAAALADEDLETVWQHSTLAMLLQRLGIHERALLHFKRAIDLEPMSATLQFNLATEYRFLGNRDKAEFHVNQAIKSNSNDVGAWLLRSQLRRQTPELNNIRGLGQLIKGMESQPQAQAVAGFALAKELEDIKDYADSFDALQKAASLRRSLMQYSPDKDLHTMSQIRSVFDSSFFTGENHGHASDEPIFVIGMPRTGTTLVERILASHPDIFAAGELSNFAVVMTQQISKQSGGETVIRDELITRSAKLDFNLLGKTYIQSTRPATGHSRLFVDKLPFNYLYLGLIHRALPNAKIIHMRRNPMDTCYAVYKTLFESGYPFSYDLQELGRYYMAYRKLMDHWEKLLPNRIHHIDYEILVNDVESESRKLIEFCGLDWNDQCLSHQHNPTAATTASAVQVREPVYQTSVDLWRNYAEQLRPLKELLQAEGINVDCQSTR